VDATRHAEIHKLARAQLDQEFEHHGGNRRADAKAGADTHLVGGALQQVEMTKP